MHVASVMLFEGPPPPYEDLVEAIEARLVARAALSPAARVRAARAGAPQVGGRPTPEPALPRALDGAPLPRLRGSAEGARRARVLPAARSRQAALGGMARRGARGRPVRDALEDPPRARGRDLRRGHHLRAVRHLARAGRAARPGQPLAAAPASLERPTARRGAGRAGHAAGRGRALDPRRVPRTAPHRRRRARRRRWSRSHGLGRAQPGAGEPLQPFDRPPPPLHLGARQPGRRQGDQGRARRHGQRRGALHGGRARSASTCAGAARTPTGSS